MVRLDHDFGIRPRKLAPVRLAHKPQEPQIRPVSPPSGKVMVRRIRRKLRRHRARQTAQKALGLIMPVAVVVVSLLLNPKQTLYTMLSWIKYRLTEPSTYQGLTALAGAIGYTLNPEALDAVVALVVAVIGVIQVIKTEKLVEKKEE